MRKPRRIPRPIPRSPPLILLNTSPSPKTGHARETRDQKHGSKPQTTKDTHHGIIKPYSPVRPNLGEEKGIEDRTLGWIRRVVLSIERTAQGNKTVCNSVQPEPTPVQTNTQGYGQA